MYLLLAGLCRSTGPVTWLCFWHLPFLDSVLPAYLRSRTTPFLELGLCMPSDARRHNLNPRPLCTIQSKSSVSDEVKKLPVVKNL